MVYWNCYESAFLLLLLPSSCATPTPGFGALTPSSGERTAEARGLRAARDFVRRRADGGRAA
eukprot:1856575-Pleurochrysis_carterae.AAC.2